MTLLYIDDDEDDLKFFYDAMKTIDISCECIMVNGGRQAIKALETLLPDYIILDVNMPELNGRQMLRHFRQDKRLNEVPIIIFSTFLNPEDIAEFKKYGANDCITKPYSFQALCIKLKDLFKNPVRPIEKNSL